MTDQMQHCDICRVDYWVDPPHKHVCRTAVKTVNLEDEVTRLRTALTGISTCSTCAACRGAALMALDPLAAIKIAYLVDERLDRVERELGAPSTTGDGAK